MSRNNWGIVLVLLFLVPTPGLNFLTKLSFAFEHSSQIRGKVIDAESQAPIGFANVTLFHLPDTIPYKLTATNTKGEFSFDNLQGGEYSIMVHFMGFKNFTTQPFPLTGRMQVLVLQLIPLEVESIPIGEVTTQFDTERPVYQLEKKIIYTENQLTGAGGSVADLLRKLPSVTQGADGKIAIHGNSNLLVFINNKPSSLKGDELLQNTPAAEVKKIELITSPSAKYDASGSGGIINIITKRGTLNGFSGNIQAGFDNLGAYSSDILLNYQQEKFSFFTGLDHNKRKNEGDVDYVTDYLADNSKLTKSGLQTAQRINTGFRAGFDYQLSPVDKISVSGNAGQYQVNNNGDWETIKVYATQNTTVRNNATDDTSLEGHYGGADVTFEHKFKPENKTLSFSALWNEVDYDDDFLNLITDLSGAEQMRQSTSIAKTHNNFQFNSDFATPTGKAGNLEIGYQLTYNKVDETYQSELSIPAPPSTTSQLSHFHDLVQAGYGTWHTMFGRFDIRTGLRGEYLTRELNTSDKSYPLKYLFLYPSLNSSFRIDPVREILFNYSRRTDQLKPIQLDPLPRWYDFYNVTVGNPNLKNEIANKTTLDYLLNYKNLNLSNELFYFSTANKIDVVRSLYKNGIFMNRVENVGSERTLGVEFNAEWTINTWLSLNEKLDFIDSWLNVQLSEIAQKKSYQQWYTVSTASFTITPTTRLEADFTYYSPSKTAQSDIEKVFLAGLSFRQMFLNKRLAFTLTGRDILGLYKKVEHIQGPDFHQMVTTYYQFPVRFSLSYKFNKFSRDERKVAKQPLPE
jgi:hypothetical protein